MKFFIYIKLSVNYCFYCY